MTINGVQDLNACTGRLGTEACPGGDPWNKTQACPGGHLQVCPRWGPVRGDGGGVINAVLLYCPVGGNVIVIHNRGVMEGERECKSFSRR